MATKFNALAAYRPKIKKGKTGHTPDQQASGRARYCLHKSALYSIIDTMNPDHTP